MISNKPVAEKSITDIVIGIIEMHENMTRIAAVSTKQNYATVAHYVGMNYDLHLAELRNRGHHGIASRYETMAKGWKQ